MPPPDALAPLDALPDGAAHPLRPGLTVLRVPKRRYRKGNTYALDLPDGGVALVDAVHKVTAPALVQHLRQRPVRALLITHRDLLNQAFGPPNLLSHCFGGAPVVVHPADAVHPGTTSLEAAADLLAQLGIAAHAVPGHTPGSVAYEATAQRLLFAGDAVVGRPYGSDPAERGASHPPIAREDWPAFVEGWNAIPGPFEAVLPLHGEPILGSDSLDVARAAATDPARVMQL